MRTIKVKLPFTKLTGIEERQSKLGMWVNALLNGSKINVIEELHYSTGSYIVVENTRDYSR
ncbi:MAG: hypothetical protein IIU03_05145 [Bacteroidales bacterium]|jgi:hypothetical protein|nr:hypothetical protein [Bacteroidales bacterium]MBQ5453992.1 hypothetical protein [Bacteroidales bacterium]MBQ5539611.1 hypothetical protein [Bacteroidales bacterium]MBR4677894.1 hypothetical protein [Bacteroidales bacterium]